MGTSTTPDRNWTALTDGLQQKMLENYSPSQPFPGTQPHCGRQPLGGQINRDPPAAPSVPTLLQLAPSPGSPEQGSDTKGPGVKRT